MDPLKLLSRSTKLHRPRNGVADSSGQDALPSGQKPQPQLFAPERQGSGQSVGPSKKRKRGQEGSIAVTDGLDFFGDSANGKSTKPSTVAQESDEEEGDDDDEAASAPALVAKDGVMSMERAMQILREHKIKLSWLNQPNRQKVGKKGSEAKTRKKQQRTQLHPQPLERFGDLKRRFGISPRLQSNVCEQGYDLATEVQLSALPLLLDSPSALLQDSAAERPEIITDGIDLLTVAPTGSGKTLAFLIPLMSKILRHRRKEKDGERHTSALILAPTKELVGQIVNEGRKLAQNTGVKIAQVRKGMKLDRQSAQYDEDEGSAVKVDILVSSPGVLHSIMKDEQDDSSAVLPAVQSLVLDEADVLLDPLFRDQTLAIWHALLNAELRVSLWSATMGSNIEELARATILERRERLAEATDAIIEAPLIRLVVGLKDSAVPNVQHKLTYAATEQGKLMGLRQLLHPATTSVDSGPPLRPPFLVFTQTIERAIALHSELMYDIPAEAGGISRIAVLHSDLSDTARDSIMTRFRQGEIWVLITTDLLSRGVDFRGVNGVVNYDIPTSSAAYVHRVGRTGRAGREGGVAVTLYSKEDIPYLKHVANVVSAAQKQKGATASNHGVQQWLLDALPTLSKNDKQKLKKRGVEARTSKGRTTDPRAARKARISTKAGFVRREENKRKGAVQGSKRRALEQDLDGSGEDAEFGGFD